MLEELPEPFNRYIEEIPIEVTDRPTRKQLRDSHVGRDELLLGLYVGHPLTDRSIDNPVMGGVIFIFQQAIEMVCDNESGLVRQVRTTVLHEIGHHFGMSETDLEELGYG